MKTYEQLLASPPETVPWTEVVEFDQWDERRACVDALYANTLGVGEGYVEWCPNDEPPSRSELLAWIWSIRPDLGNEIIENAPAELKELIESYQARLHRRSGIERKEQAMRSVKEAIAAYTRNALMHREATKEGDSDRANAAYDALVGAYRYLRESGGEGLEALVTLMGHEDEGVRCWAAAHCLDWDAPKAEAVLTELSQGQSLVAFSAQMVLSQWKEGTFKTPM